ncbi:GMC family oxidoreductase N-terminal domain-containing protein [Fictibacillus sp. NRS-1165]|uniref:GMC family oxidoreductase N-terminal domain-containing protein n=1 Tax=Fictibacillus sp. NRS-1165 TaxID=3144463 RepID=UPI003D2079AB
MKFREGCESLGIQHAVSPLAILSAPHNGRKPCINSGFCIEGCMPDHSKTTPLNTFVPESINNGAVIIPNAMATRVVTKPDGTIRGVEYLLEKELHFQEARIVILAAYAIETPRLLLHSAKDGLANSSADI